MSRSSFVCLAVFTLGCRVAADGSLNTVPSPTHAPSKATELLRTMVFPLGLGDGSPYDMVRAVASRKPLVLAGLRASHECHVRGDMVVDEFPEPRQMTEAADAVHFPWLKGASGVLEVEYESSAMLRLGDGFVARGIGQCDAVTHVSDMIEVGSWIRVTGSLTMEVEHEPFLVPIKATLRPVKVEREERVEPRRHVEPMVYIEGGVFEGRRIAAFWIDRFEVGVASYRECIEDGYCMEPECVEPGYCETTLSEHATGLPIFFVRQLDAEVYCTWSGKRLPSLREWQWAARGREEGRTYPWGDEPADCTRAHGRTMAAEGPCADPEVGSRGNRPLGASRDGVEDLAGNVEEWVSEPRVSAGSSVNDYFEESDLGEFTTQAARREYRPTSGIRCAADEPPGDALERSQPNVTKVPDLRLSVHDNPGQRTPTDAHAYCESFEAGDLRGWRLPSDAVLLELRKRLELPPVAYWSIDAAETYGFRRTLCIAEIN